MKPPFLSIFLLLSLVSVVKLVSGGFSINEEIVPSGRTGTIGRLVKRDERTPIAATELGEILSVDIDDGTGKGKNSYHLQFISLEPNALFLPVLLHADMVFYVQTGNPFQTSQTLMDYIILTLCLNPEIWSCIISFLFPPFHLSIIHANQVYMFCFVLFCFMLFINLPMFLSLYIQHLLLCYVWIERDREKRREEILQNL